MHYLVLGANGLVGKSLCKNLSSRGYPFTGTYRETNVHKGLKCDILNEKDLVSVFQATEPDAVINATNLAGGVNFCESNPELAKEFHFDANVTIGELCNKYDARMVLISSDYVFDGEKPRYKEDDPKNPLNIYGKMKLEAEQWMEEHLTHYTIVRTTNVFGWDPLTKTPNFIMGIYRKLKESETVSVPTYLWGNPTYVDDLAKAIIELTGKGINDIFHVVGRSFINRYDWIKKTCEAAGWDTSLITSADDIPANIVPRPLKSNLDTKKFESICKTRLKDVDEGINAFIQDMREDE